MKMNIHLSIADLIYFLCSIALVIGYFVRLERRLTKIDVKIEMICKALHGCLKQDYLP